MRNLKANSPLILSAAACVGTLTTAYLAARASYKAANVIRTHEEQNPPAANQKERLKERTRLVWRLYIPPAISTISTIGVVVGANRMGHKKTVATQAALSFVEQGYALYRDKVAEELGPRKDQSIRDKVIADQVAANPPPGVDVLTPTGSGVLCCELFTGRYFICDIEKLRRAVNDINAQLLKHDYATFDDFYWLVGLKPTAVSGNLGWSADKLMELIFSSALIEEGRPCMTFEYNYYKTL